MKLRKNLLKRSLLYLILDKQTIKNCSLKTIYSIVPSRYINIVQLRDKKSAKSDVLSLAIKFSKRLAKTKVLFIINDYVDLAFACSADGVHLGQDDLPLKQARKILGKDKIIGISCHNLFQALKAQKDGADYIGIGPIFKTATKTGYRAIGLEVLRKLKDKIKIPYFAIGDIHQGNIKEISAVGARRIACCRAILNAHDPGFAAEQLFKKLN